MDACRRSTSEPRGNGAAGSACSTEVRKLHKYHLLILDDFSYVTSESAETSVLFELIGALRRTARSW